MSQRGAVGSRKDDIGAPLLGASTLDKAIEPTRTSQAPDCLGAYWQRRMGKNNFVAYQASARGGVVKVGVVNDRAFLGGQAVIVAKGELVSETCSSLLLRSTEFRTAR